MCQPPACRLLLPLLGKQVVSDVQLQMGPEQLGALIHDFTQVGNLAVRLRGHANVLRDLSGEQEDQPGRFVAGRAGPDPLLIRVLDRG